VFYPLLPGALFMPAINVGHYLCPAQKRIIAALIDSNAFRRNEERELLIFLQYDLNNTPKLNFNPSIIS